jgi:haloacetate dehalogenase
LEVVRRKLSKTDQGTSFFDPHTVAGYIRCIEDPTTVYGMCEDYRATFGVDLDMDTVDFNSEKVTCPSRIP